MEPYITLFFFVTDIYESFVRPHLNFGDAVYDQLNNGSLSDITESLQYNEALTITAAVRGPLKEKLYQQKQPFRGVLRKRCSENMQQIYRRTPCQSVISITLRHGCFPVTLLHIFRTTFS